MAVSNPNPEPITDNVAVKHELAALGMTREIVEMIADAAAAAKADTMAVEPVNAPGTNAYFKGTAATRLGLIPLGGWRMGRKGNVEATVNDALGIQVVYQNVDMACTERNPQAISHKGSGSRKLIYDGQLELFQRADDKPKQIHGVAPRVWLICVSTEGKKLRAEVSCPEVFEGDQFEGFVKRIFVVDRDYDPSPRADKKPGDDHGAGDYEVKIVKK